MEIDLDSIKLEAKKELARRDFFYYANLMAPDFYREDREFLVYLCNQLQDFYFSNEELLVINLPPRHGKSRTAGLFSQWVFGQNPSEQIMTGSYNETLSTTFSKNVRNAIQEKKVDPNQIVYNDIFPETRIKKGDGAMQMWSLEGQHTSYLATSPTGTATGFGSTLMIIDDLIKSAKEANNERILEEHWDWFRNTMLSRLEANGKIIIIMTRWATNDLAGRILRQYKEEGRKVRHISMKALQDDGTMLCEEILPKKVFESRITTMGEDIVNANYQQKPIDLKGRLYSELKTYTELPDRSLYKGTYSYCDTADQGSDYLCNIIFDVYGKEGYIRDVYYTKEPMEVTEPETARRLYEFDVNVAYFESNAGGRGFARQISYHLLNDYNSNYTTIIPFHQSENKNARILSNATWVMNNIYHPHNWKIKWPKYYNALKTYQREGRNEHDDAPDAITGVSEVITKGIKTKRKSRPRGVRRK